MSDKLNRLDRQIVLTFFEGLWPTPFFRPSREWNHAMWVVEKIGQCPYRVNVLFFHHLQLLATVSEKLSGDHLMNWPWILFSLTPEMICEAALQAVPFPPAEYKQKTPVLMGP